MKCSVCGKEYNELFAGVCAECLSIDARDSKEEEERELHRLGEGFYQDDRLTEIIPGRGYFGSIFYKPENKVYRKKEAGEFVEMTEEEKNEAFERMLISGGFDERDRKALLPSIKILYKKYEPYLVTGEYFMCKKTDYGKKCSGVVIDKHGGVMIYKVEDDKYFDPDKVRTSSYVPDDAIIAEPSDDI